MHLGGDRAQLVGGRLDGVPLAILLDIDGTLAPIAPRPEEAIVPAGTQRTLARLAASPDVAVALVTGRTVADAARMIDVSGAWIVGNHGLEMRAPSGELETSPDARQYESVVARARERLRAVISEVPGAWIEDKRWSLSVHYRQVPGQFITAVIAAAREVGADSGLRITDGKKIVELRPPIAVDKGSAALLLAQRMGARRAGASLLFSGDDRTDEDAFRAIRAAMPQAVTVLVAADDDVPDAGTEAEFVVLSTEDLSVLLGWLADRRGAPEG